MNFNELRPGDIILFKLNGTLFHAAIFAPDEKTNIIDVTSPAGCARKTLKGLVSSLSAGIATGNIGCFFNRRLSVHVVRHCYLNGSEIAEQAEFWRLRNVSYDIHSLIDLTKASWTTPSAPNQEANLQIYCNHAQKARVPLIDAPKTPNSLVIFLSILIAPLLNLPRLCVSFVMQLIHYFQPEKNQGTSCGGFILSVLGAVSLKEADCSDKTDCIDRLGSLINVNPENYHPDLLEEVLSAPETFRQLGTLEQFYSQDMDDIPNLCQV